MLWDAAFSIQEKKYLDVEQKLKEASKKLALEQKWFGGFKNAFSQVCRSHDFGKYFAFFLRRLVQKRKL